MTKLCERPGCSEPGAAAYGMIPEDLLFWIAPLRDAPLHEPSVLCQRHADAMRVPRGWTLDDRREEFPRLFRPLPRTPDRPADARTRARRHRRSGDDVPEQLQIDGTGEIPRPVVVEDAETSEVEASPVPQAHGNDGARIDDAVSEPSDPITTASDIVTGSAARIGADAAAAASSDLDPSPEHPVASSDACDAKVARAEDPARVGTAIGTGTDSAIDHEPSPDHPVAVLLIADEVEFDIGRGELDDGHDQVAAAAGREPGTPPDAAADVGRDGAPDADPIPAGGPHVPSIARDAMTEPEATEPEATELEATGPAVAEPDATEPEATGPAATESEATGPAVVEPDADDPTNDVVIDESVPWRPEFDANDDLDGLLEVSSPLLARAFRGTDRPRP